MLWIFIESGVQVKKRQIAIVSPRHFFCRLSLLTIPVTLISERSEDYYTLFCVKEGLKLPKLPASAIIETKKMYHRAQSDVAFYVWTLVAPVSSPRAYNMLSPTAPDVGQGTSRLSHKRLEEGYVIRRFTTIRSIMFEVECEYTNI